MPNLGIIASSKSGNLTAFSYDSIATVTLSSAASSISFTSIPATYKHLQIRGIMQTSGTAGGASLKTNFNSDTAANYSVHQMYGNRGASQTAIGDANTTRATYAPSGGFQSFTAADGANMFTTHIIDILNYSNTSIYKTLRAVHAREANTAGRIMFESGNWRSTSAINSITFTASDGTTGAVNFNQYSSFALYGIKG